jgi:hypothetical protein
LVYVAALGAVLLLGGPLSVRRLVVAVWAASGVVVVYALLVYLLRADSRVDPFQAALLSRPLGYANALGILAGIGTVLAVGLTARGTGGLPELLAAGSISPFAAALYLSGSRGSAVAVVVGLAVMLLVDPDRSDVVGALCVLAPGAALVITLSRQSSLANATTSGATATHAGYVLLSSIVLVGGAVAVASREVRRIGGWVERHLRAGRALAAAALAALAAVVAGAATVGPSWRQHFTAEGYRPRYWHVAWIEYLAHPWLGSGAGTFGDYWVRYGIPGVAGGALDAHNLYLETLAELGPIGLALLAAMLALPLFAAAHVRRRPLVPAALAAYSALLAHSALDWDWEMPAAMLAGLFCAAALVTCACEPAPNGTLSRSARGAIFALACALALFALLAQIS